MAIKDRGDATRALHQIHLKQEAEAKEKAKATIKRTPAEEQADIIKTLHEQNAFADIHRLKVR